ncbi:uncharacterized protein DSM5745_00706 [Aspergillus mulundensis]|uniref:DUF7580 domain-containing protein n=1 Tax=Aspergillus mulundensis TaxID=1810919 RepID=A0A3D8T4B3_9EURO|nr:hypothetical protein DSM5745_00706 [Aspergillus mulundensis]RDW93384.1 hypothetical protein DSM5745_00706 [Aspergillus mulundensis]
MSGIEVAGLLLGALPILFAAVDSSRSTIERGRLFFRTRSYVKKLADALLLQQQILAETTRSLLLASGCSDVHLMENDPAGYLSQESIQDQLRDYLGPENTKALDATLSMSNEAVQKIASFLSGVVPGAKGCADLHQIITSNQGVDSRRPDLIPRVKLVFGVSELKATIRDIDDTTNTLTRFSNLVISNRRDAGDSPSRKATKLAKVLRQVRGSANDLYHAIHRGLGAGCHSTHETQLMLEDRIDTSTSARGVSQDITFRLLFAADAGHRRICHEAMVQVLKGESRDDELFPARSSQVSRVTLVVPEATPGPAITLVHNLCAAINTAGCMEPHVTFVLSNGAQFGTIAAVKKTVIPCLTSDLVSLKALLLRDQQGNPHTTALPLKHRMLLALKLASNLLQLLQTQWLPKTWSKDMILFLRPQQRIDCTRPFISLTLDNEPIRTFAEVEPKLALLDLGILLLEIWHNQSLEFHFCLADTPVGYYERLTWALKWLEDGDDPLPELYDKAVSYCIVGVLNSEVRTRGWEDPKFGDAVCANVVEPLSQSCKQWR